jgi:aspartokinase
MSGAKVIHRFVRNPNIDSNIHNRVANRFDPFKNTITTLKDPATNRTLTLIGTTNSSTTLAHRTKVLCE